jgi:hypothetical protein
MSEHEQLYPQATPALAAQRRRLAPGPAEAFRAFSRSVFVEGELEVRTKQLLVAAEMRPGAAYAHSALTLDTITHYHVEQASNSGATAGILGEHAEANMEGVR